MIKKIEVSRIFSPEGLPLCLEYETECGYTITPEFNQSIELYKAMEDAGSLVALGVFDGDALVGFAITISHPLPHYSVMATSIDAIFINKKSRKFGSGKRLFKAIEELAISMGSKQLVCSAPPGGSFDRVAGSFGLTPTSRVLGKSL